MLMTFGCEGIQVRILPGEDTQLFFKHAGLSIQVPVRSKGYAEALGRKRLRGRYSKATIARIERQSKIAAWSLALDWLKANLMLVEMDILSFEEAFMSHVLLTSGKTVGQVARLELPLLMAGKGDDQ
ncbi:MAG: hypothetical protein ACE5JO_09130 [Candidatus Binatia bacterium]